MPRMSVAALPSWPSNIAPRASARLPPPAQAAGKPTAPPVQGVRPRNDRPHWANANDLLRSKPRYDDLKKVFREGAPREVNLKEVVCGTPPRAAEQFMHDQQRTRLEAAHAPLRERMRERLMGIARLSSTGAPAAIQLEQARWSSTATTELIRVLHWEEQRTDPRNVDLVELAHAIACVERWRAQGKPELRDASISAMLKALSLDTVLDLNILSSGYAAGAIGYEQKGKSIWANYLSHLGACATLTGAESLAAAAAVRGAAAMVQTYFDLNTGNERLSRKPQEELAAALTVNLAARTDAAPNMKKAVALARGLRKSSDLSVRLRNALKGKDSRRNRMLLAGLLAEAENNVLANESAIKSRLDVFSESWSGRWREVLTRSGSAALVSGGAIASAFAPFATPAIIPACVAGAAGLQMLFRLSDWDGRGASSAKMKQLFNFIRSTGWIDRQKMTPTAIAQLYDAYEAGSMTREDLRRRLADSGAFELEKIQSQLVLPVSLRMRMADTLLRGKLAEAIDKERVAARARAGKSPSDAPSGLLHDRKVDAAGVAEIRQLLADLLNLQRATELVAQQPELPDRGRVDVALARAARLLRQVRDPEVRDLFARDMKGQTKAASHALALQKGAADAYRFNLGAGSIPTIVTGPLAGTTGEVLKAVDADGGSAAGTSTAAGVAIGGVGTAAVPALVVSAMLGHTSRQRFKSLTASADRDTNTATVDVDGRSATRPINPSHLSARSVASLLSGDTMPASIEFRLGSKGKTLPISVDLTTTQPYHNQERRDLDARSRAKATWKMVAAGAADALESATDPLLRPFVAFQMHRTRKDRRELHKLVDAANARMRAGRAGR